MASAPLWKVPVLQEIFLLSLPWRHVSACTRKAPDCSCLCPDSSQRKMGVKGPAIGSLPRWVSTVGAAIDPHWK